MMQWGNEAYIRHKQEMESTRKSGDGVPTMTKVILGVVVAYVIVLFGGPTLRAKFASKPGALQPAQASLAQPVR